ncbi:MAG: crossover junction endodeoxyribonuclease RuvC [Candidatus Zixiibacteriota bacterium]|nr:MAG: crossover junction endodeoxyribonuclease RuvC [candidate division Zixibacteria bacterium]
MIVLGVDPGLNVTGYAVLESRQQRIMLLEAGVVRSRPIGSISSRLKEIGDGMSEVINQFRPGAIAIENLYSHYVHPRTAIIMGHARGVICLKGAEAGIEVFEYAATRIKKALTGNGRATKSQMQTAVMTLMELKTVPEPPDTADAIAIALCHARVQSKGELAQT